MPRQARLDIPGVVSLYVPEAPFEAGSYNLCYYKFMYERCKRICGVETSHCFIGNAKQMECIADMVINKISGVSSCINLALAEETSEGKDTYLIRGLHSLSELTNWIKYLQMVRDITMTARVMDERENERRRESRYPIPEFYKQYIHLSVDWGGGAIPCTLVNFSQHGLRFICNEEIPLMRICRCRFSTSHMFARDLLFPITVRHCLKRDEGYEVGAEILAVHDKTSFNFFRSVIDALQAISPDQETSGEI